ncbi:BadF/BadG/BcrA/BcrD ATPase family protein [Brevibacterium antiquum]|uniref:BadF/BadG/BcrA/BcrD ATPase family protein n=1 Tax=Brevibacterium antiquum TaxID=234835 RepID=UPI0018DF17A9|nr:BadF/BadG/BcrA/BcrD ATPase family protein [Brevibacterium antiquum]
MSAFVLGIDIGGTGSRAALAEVDATWDLSVVATMTGPGVEISAAGSNVLDIASGLISSAQKTWGGRLDQIAGVGIGATGIASLSEDPTSVIAEISGRAGAPAAAAIDAVTAHLGALGGRGGAVTVLGTGAISIAHPGPDEHGIMSPDWARTDGWGHLFGDRGGGAWLGRRSLELALRTHDGVDPSGRSLLESATRLFGSPATWPSQFYTRDNRAGLLADFAVEVAALSDSGDTVATGLLREAGVEAARSALAAANSLDSPLRIALTGGLVRAGDALVSGFRDEAARLHTGVIIEEPAGDPLAGSVRLGVLAAEGKLRAQNSVLWM